MTVLEYNPRVQCEVSFGEKTTRGESVLEGERKCKDRVGLIKGITQPGNLLVLVREPEGSLNRRGRGDKLEH